MHKQFGQFGELPPRARRIRKCGSTAVRMIGTTSACAENTGFFEELGNRCGNYLRVRGEYNDCIEFDGEHLELPPRARRILLLPHVVVIPRGTTSACAENTLSGGKMWFWDWNYLRVRGEY